MSENETNNIEALVDEIGRELTPAEQEILRKDIDWVKGNVDELRRLEIYDSLFAFDGPARKIADRILEDENGEIREDDESEKLHSMFLDMVEGYKKMRNVYTMYMREHSPEYQQASKPAPFHTLVGVSKNGFAVYADRDENGNVTVNESTEKCPPDINITTEDAWAFRLNKVEWENRRLKKTIEVLREKVEKTLKDSMDSLIDGASNDIAETKL